MIVSKGRPPLQENARAGSGIAHAFTLDPKARAAVAERRGLVSRLWGWMAGRRVRAAHDPKRRMAFAALGAAAFPLWPARGNVAGDGSNPASGRGTLRAIGSQGISSADDIILLSGIETVGDAGAGMPLVRDPAVDRAYVASNPTTSVIDAAGKGYRRAGGLWGFRLPISQALVRMGEGKLAEQVSWLDFLPYGKHAGILDHSNTDDWSERLQTMLDAVPSGARIYIPGRVNLERGLRCTKSIALYGDPGREDFDNSWDYSTGGSQILYRGNDGDALTFPAVPGGNTIHNVVLRDFIVRGNRHNDDHSFNPRAKSGRGIVFAGSSASGFESHTSNIRIDMENVHVCQAVDQGIDLSGTLYGGSIRNMLIHRCGRNGFRAVSGGAGIGEMWLARLRIYQCGLSGSDDWARANFAWAAGQLQITEMSTSEAAGPGAIIGGGPFEINGLQTESNSDPRRSPENQAQLVIGCDPSLGAGAPDAGTVYGTVTNWMSAPAEGYRGSHARLLGNAKYVRLAGFLSGSLAGEGCHVRRERGGEDLDVAALVGASRFVDLTANYQVRIREEVLARCVSPGEPTGNGETVLFAPQRAIDRMNSFDDGAGAFVAKVNFVARIEINLTFATVEKRHDRAVFYLETDEGAGFNSSNTFGERRDLNLGSLANAETGRASISLAASVPLRKGHRWRLRYAVSGGDAVSLVARESYISIRSAA